MALRAGPNVTQPSVRGDRVKTTPVTPGTWPVLLLVDDVRAIEVPDARTWPGRDPARASKDVRRGLMSTLHQVSRLLLRRGIVTSADVETSSPPTR